MIPLIYSLCFLFALAVGYLTYLNYMVLSKITMPSQEDHEPDGPEPKPHPIKEHFVAKRKIRYRTEQDEYRDEVS